MWSWRKPNSTLLHFNLFSNSLLGYGHFSNWISFQVCCLGILQNQTVPREYSSERKSDVTVDCFLANLLDLNLQQQRRKSVKSVGEPLPMGDVGDGNSVGTSRRLHLNNSSQLQNAEAAGGCTHDLTERCWEITCTKVDKNRFSESTQLVLKEVISQAEILTTSGNLWRNRRITLEEITPKPLNELSPLTATLGESIAALLSSIPGDERNLRLTLSAS